MAMTAITRVYAARPTTGPCLTTGPWSGPVIIAFFLMGVALFVLGLFAM
jgi:hypothetical protein